MVSGEFLQYKVMFITFRYGSILEGDKDLCKPGFKRQMFLGDLDMMLSM